MEQYLKEVERILGRSLSVEERAQYQAHFQESVELYGRQPFAQEAVERFTGEGDGFERPERDGGDDEEESEDFVPFVTPEGQSIASQDEADQFFLEQAVQGIGWLGPAGVASRVGQAELLDMYQLAATDEWMRTQIDSFMSAPQADGMQMSPDAARAAAMAAFLAQRSPAAESLVTQWAQANDVWNVPQTMNGVDSTQVLRWAGALGVTAERASIVIKTADQFGLDVALYAAAWSNASGRDGEVVDDVPRPRRTDSDESGLNFNRGGGRIGQRKELAALDASLANRLKTEVAAYGADSVLPIIALEDKDLAERLFTDPHSVSSAEASRALKALGDVEALLTEAPGLTGQVEWLAQQERGRTVEVPVDDATVIEAARTLSRAWNMNLSDAYLSDLSNGFLSHVMDTVKSNLTNPFQAKGGGGTLFQFTGVPNTSAYIESALRETDEYRRLFGNLGPGESEEEYASKFSSASVNQLGFDDPESVRAGMASGDINAVSGRALMSPDTYRQSTGLQRKMAQLGQVLREMT